MRIWMLSWPLLLASLVVSCTTSGNNEGFALVQLEQQPTCRILSYNGEPVRRTVAATGRFSMWGLGKCPGKHPAYEDISIWVQQAIDTGRHAATMRTKTRDDGTYQRITIRRAYDGGRPGYFRYIWVRH